MVMGFFITRGMSIKKWHALGLLDREKLIYEFHLKNETLSKIYCFTYGVDDDKYSFLLHDNFKIIPMHKFFNSKLGIIFYSLILPFIHFRKIKKCNILKTDQMDGSWSAVLAKIFFSKNKKLIIRTGFPLSIFMREKKKRFLELIAILIEKLAYSKCDFATVSSFQSKSYIANKYRIDEKNIEVLFNYIDTELFYPSKLEPKNDRLLFIGRLDNQKNLVNLFEALSIINKSIDIYGDGKLKKELISFSKKMNIDVNFYGIISNRELPNVLRKYKYFVLPSFYEGMPKTLIEAMACGLVCIGTDTFGINEIIIDNHNGYLIKGFNRDDLYCGINNALDKKNHNEVQLNATKSIFKKFSLQSYAQKESKIFSNLNSNES